MESRIDNYWYKRVEIKNLKPTTPKHPVPIFFRLLKHWYKYDVGQLGSYAESSSGPKMLFYFISSEFLDFLIPAWRKQFLLLLEFGDMRNGNEDRSWSHELVSLADKSVVICSTKAYNISSIKLNWRPEMSRYNQLHRRIKNLLPVRLFTFFYGRLKVSYVIQLILYLVFITLFHQYRTFSITLFT